jgi:hypothetical protein
MFTELPPYSPLNNPESPITPTSTLAAEMPLTQQLRPKPIYLAAEGDFLSYCDNHIMNDANDLCY